MPSSYAIGSHFEELIKDKVESGRYSSASEVVRVALRLFEEQEEARALELQRLRAEIEKGERGAGIPAEEVFASLHEKYAKMQKEQEEKK